MSNIFNKPIYGDVSRYSAGLAKQYPSEKLVDALDRLFEVIPEVDAVRWTQYTPYFNDGDACTFSAYVRGVHFDGIDEGGDYEDGFHDAWSITYRNDKGVRPYAPEGTPELTSDQALAIKDFEAVLAGGHHDVVLNELFGDPAEVTATREGFDVEYYDHE